MLRSSYPGSFFFSTKKCLLGIFFLLILTTARSQGTWVWMHGANINNPPANYGTMFIPAPTNDPPGTYKPFSWTDANGKFWIFGGFNCIVFTLYSDLWQFDPVTNMWTWMGGTGVTNSSGIYGTIGVPSVNNRPGARYRGASWTDNNGNLWLFGGSGFDINGSFGMLNDLWKYDPVTGEWTWMKGPNTVNTGGSYGTVGVQAASNLPTPRQEHMASWKSANGDLWFYGGQDASGFRGDMWRYNIASNMWTWMSGSNAVNVAASYGIMNVAAASNTPGSRCTYARWTDSQGTFWLFAGHVVNSTFNDVWKYDVNTNQWTWAGGGNGTNNAGNYGNACEANNYFPSTRTESLCTWRDSCDRLWFVGGNNSTILNAANSDVWFFDPVVNQFTLVGGSAAINTPGNYGTMTVSSPSNYPPSSCGSVGWTDSNGDFWLFGGLLDPAGDNMNAIWRYTRPQACPDYPFTITANPTTGCANNPIGFTVTPVINNFTYNWNFGDPSSSSNTSTSITPTHTYNSAGTYTVTLIVNSNVPCNVVQDTLYDTITIASFGAFSIGNDTTFCGVVSMTLDAQIANATYVWSNGDTTQTTTVTQPGTYSVIVGTGNCLSYDTISITGFVPPDLGNDTNFCSGQTYTLDPGQWDSYLWSDGSTNQTLVVSGTNTYWVTVNSGSCTFSDTITLGVNPIPVVSLGNDTTLCPGTIYPLDAGNSGATFAWSTGATTQIINVDHEDIYDVVVTANNCSGIGTVHVMYHPQLDLGPDLQLCNVISLNITAGDTGYSYLWNTGDTSNVITVFEPGTYHVTENNGTCILSDTIEVTGVAGSGMLFIPNAFTPTKSAGINDEFQVFGDGITSYHIDIFDRWGNLVYKSDDILQTWNGVVKSGKPFCDTYVYRIIYRTECSGEQDYERIGHVNVIR